MRTTIPYLRRETGPQSDWSRWSSAVSDRASIAEGKPTEPRPPLFQPRALSRHPIRRRTAGSMAMSVGILLLALGVNVPAADYPTWWTARTVVITDAPVTNDFGAVNLGQLKWFATNACAELEANLSGGAGTALKELVGDFAYSNNYTAVNVGQVKNVAAKIYDRLIAEGLTNGYPWTETTTDDNDYAACNVGQLKYVFSFDLENWPETEDTSFTLDRGFYANTFTTTVSCASNAVIYYTTNGTAPSFTNGSVATGSVDVVIDGTTVLRVMAHEANKKPTDIDTQTYLFLDDVIAATNAPPGYTNTWRCTYNGNTNEVDADYGMDTNVVHDPSYSNLVDGALLSIPTLSITMDPDDLFGEDGIYYQNSDEGYERAAGIELIYPDSREGCHANCSIKPHSRFCEAPGTSGEDINLKRSFRLSFKREYGETKLRFPFFENAPENATSAVGEFDRLVLRAGSNRGYAGKKALNQLWTTYTRDQWGRDSQIAMSGTGVHGTFVHLYLNGIYWGVYNACERPDAWFTSAYMGGEKEDWYAGKEGTDISGDSSTWGELFDMCVDTNVDWTATNAFEDARELLDVTNFCDYVIAWWYCGGGDWEEKTAEFEGPRNVYVGNRNNPTNPVMYFCWDMEVSWAQSTLSTDGAWVKPSFLNKEAKTTEGQLVAGVFRPLWQNAEFRMLFADRLYEHCFNDGALSDANSQERWMKLCNFVEDAMIAESARWGDSKAPYGPGNDVDVITRNDHWYNARDYVFRLMHGNAKRLVIQCREAAVHGHPIYPVIDPPELTPYGGVASGSSVTVDVSAIDGEIYYTTDGSDPREYGTGDAAGTLYTNSIVLSTTTTVKARARSGGVWSALGEATFHFQEPEGGVRITEIMYNPPGDNDYEFVELKNTGMSAVDLSNWKLSNDIDYTFPNNTTLSPGEYYLVAPDDDPSAFAARYGVVPDGEFTGHLKASLDDPVELRDSANTLVQSVAFDDDEDAGWPEDADGNGFSLVILDPNTNWNSATNWRASAWTNGSPAADDLFYEHLTNSRPAVSADAFLMYFVSNTVPIKGSVADDGLPSPTNLTVTWSKLGGPGTATFADATALETTVDFSCAGIYTVALEVCDGVYTCAAANAILILDEPPTSNMVFHLRSDSGISTNAAGGVTNWADKTANGNDATQTAAACCPTWHTNVYKALPALKFDGTNDCLEVNDNTGAIGASGPYTNKAIAMAFRTGDDITTRQVLYEQGGTNSGLNVYIADGNLYMCAWSLPAWGPAWLETEIAKNVQYTLQLCFTDTNLWGTVNSETIGETNAVGSLASSSDGVCVGGVSGWTRFADGSTASSSNHFGGWISEVIQFDRQECVSTYLKTRSGIGTACRWSGGTALRAFLGWVRGVFAPSAAGVSASAGGAVLPDPLPDLDTFPSSSVDITLAVGTEGNNFFIRLNDDDDNDNGTNDLDEAGTVTNENDLALMTVELTGLDSSEAGGTLTLSAGWSGADYNVELWTSSDKGTPVPLPVTWYDAPQSGISTNYYVEGTNLSTYIGDAGFKLKYAKDEYFTRKTVTGIVGIVDLDIDADYDADIDVSDENIETTQGGAVGINSDDDDWDENVDRDETNSITGEDDLQQITLKFGPSLSAGTVKLETVYSGVGRIAIWEGSNKTTAVSLTNTWDLSTNTVPSNLWIEGISPSTNGARDVELHLSYENGGFAYTDTVAVTVCELFYGAFGHDAQNYGWPPAIPTEYGAFTNHVLSKGAVLRAGEYVLVRAAASSFLIRIANSQTDYRAALHTEDAYVGLVAHANTGLGPAFTTGCVSIADFFNVGTPTAGVSCQFLHDTYPSFSVGAGDYAHGTTNYNTTELTYERFPNHTYTNPPAGWPILTNVAVGAAFPTNYFRSGYDRMHYYTKDADYATTRSTNRVSLLVSAGAADKPELKYAKLFLNQCRSGTCFSDTMNYGVLFYNTDDDLVPSMACEYRLNAYLDAILDDKSNADIESDLDSGGDGDIYGHKVF